MNSIIFFLFVLLYLVLLVFFSLFKKTTVGIDSPFLNLIKPLIPSWKFYDDFEETRLFFYRIKKNESETFSDWIPLYQAPAPKLAHFFINPQGNLILAAHSHIQTLIEDIEHHDAKLPFEETLSYKITKNFIHYALIRKFHEGGFYQFKLASSNLEAKPLEDIMVSPLYNLLSNIGEEYE